jgi:hypothetical protein
MLFFSKPPASRLCIWPVYHIIDLSALATAGNTLTVGIDLSTGWMDIPNKAI